jgi:hypothetical protein
LENVGDELHNGGAAKRGCWKILPTSIVVVRSSVRVRVSVLRAYTQNYSPNSSPLDGSNLDARTKVPTHTIPRTTTIQFTAPAPK